MLQYLPLKIMNWMMNWLLIFILIIFARKRYVRCAQHRVTCIMVHHALDTMLDVRGVRPHER